MTGEKEKEKQKEKEKEKEESNRRLVCRNLVKAEKEGRRGFRGGFYKIWYLIVFGRND